MANCKLCGCPVEGRAGRLCIACYARCCKTCPMCMKHGRLKPAYQKQPACMGGSEEQALCPTCRNQRIIFVPAE
jgi:hypothetical protein